MSFLIANLKILLFHIFGSELEIYLAVVSILGAAELIAKKLMDPYVDNSIRRVEMGMTALSFWVNTAILSKLVISFVSNFRPFPKYSTVILSFLGH